MSELDRLREGIKRIKDSERGEKTGGDFVDNVARSRTSSGGIDSLALDSHRTGRENGGIACDVTRGPCRCGAWH